MAIHPGDRLAGYAVTHLLGRGGMGEVWSATSDEGERVAIKVLLPRAAIKPALVRRFAREAMITRAIQSPFVCELLGDGQTEDGAPFLVFEHLVGETLSQRLRRESSLGWEQTRPIIDDVLSGLEAAHAAGVVHRDLKPSNIFLATLDGGRTQARLLDFGISKIAAPGGDEATSLTAFNATLGSFAYMAPEQVRGSARVDERADLYAAGVIVYRTLTGRLPFDGPTGTIVLALKTTHHPPTLSDATGHPWPAGVEAFVARTLSTAREGRYPTARAALAAWRGVEAFEVPAAAPADGASPFEIDDRSTDVDDPPTMTPHDGTVSDPPVSRR